MQVASNIIVLSVDLSTSEYKILDNLPKFRWDGGTKVDALEEISKTLSITKKWFRINLLDYFDIIDDEFNIYYLTVIPGYLDFNNKGFSWETMNKLNKDLREYILQNLYQYLE